MKKYLIFLSLIIFFAIPAFADDMVDDCYDMAKNYYTSGQFDKALEYVDMILNVNPAHFGACYLKVVLTKATGTLGDTIFDKSINLRPINVKSGIKQSDDFNNKGQEYYDFRDFESAQKAFQAAIKANPRNYYAYNNLGLTYWKMEKYSKAEAAFKKSYGINKNFTAPLVNLAQACIEQKQYAKAEKYLNTVIAQNKNKNEYCAYYLQGVLYKKTYKYQKAIKSFNSAVLAEPKFALSYIQLADAYYYTNDFAWSNSTLEKYLDLCPNDDYAYYMLYRNYFQLKDYNVAKNYLVRAIMLNNCAEYRVSLAELEKLLDNPWIAIAILKTIKEPSAAILNEAGQCYLKIKDNKNALTCFNATAMRPDFRPIYLYNAAMVYKNIGDIENYKRTMLTIKSIEPDTYQDYIDLSGIYLDSDSKEKALELLNQGIKKYPDNKDLYEAKLRLYKITSDTAGINRTKRELDRILK